jgi:hypothetical protein
MKGLILVLNKWVKGVEERVRNRRRESKLGREQLMTFLVGWHEVTDLTSDSRRLRAARVIILQ